MGKGFTTGNKAHRVSPGKANEQPLSFKESGRLAHRPMPSESGMAKLTSFRLSLANVGETPTLLEYTADCA
jgi:hypothetical protein